MKAIVQLFLLLVIATLVTGKNIPKTADDLGLPVDDSDSDSLPAEVENDPERASFDTTLTDLDFPYDEENDPGSGWSDSLWQEVGLIGCRFLFIYSLFRP